MHPFTLAPYHAPKGGYENDNAAVEYKCGSSNTPGVLVSKHDHD